MVYNTLSAKLHSDKIAIFKEVNENFKCVSDEAVNELNWSPWLDFNSENIRNVIESEGVYKIHAGMKILFIGSGQNLRESILICLSDPCRNKAKRFSYAITAASDKVQEQLVIEYRKKHNDTLPECMEN
jgi:hypothetical protein